MKKKMIYLMITAVALFIGFEIGRQTQINTTGENVVETMPNGVDLTDDTQYNYIDKFIGSITDWNTDGKELAIMTDNGYEFYTEKQNQEYKPERKQYIGFSEFLTWETQGNTLYITTTDGNIYSFDRQENKTMKKELKEDLEVYIMLLIQFGVMVGGVIYWVAFGYQRKVVLL